MKMIRMILRTKTKQRIVPVDEDEATDIPVDEDEATDAPADEDEATDHTG